MKKVLVTLLVLIVLGAIGYIGWQNMQIIKTLSEISAIQTAQLTGMQSTGTIDTGVSIAPKMMRSDLSGHYTLVLQANTTDSTLTDISVKDITSKEETKLMSIDNLYKENPENSAFVSGDLYVIKRVGYNGQTDGSGWTDELRLYTSAESGTKLFSEQGLGFSVSPNGQYIVVSGKEAHIIGKDGKDILHYAATGDKDAQYSFSMRSEDNMILWGTENHGPGTTAFISIELSGGKVTKYNVSKLALGSDISFNPTTAKVAYSTYPPIFDVDTQNAFTASKKKVVLSVYDLHTGKKTTVDASITKKFEPVWISNTSLEYNSTGDDTRVQKTIE